MVSRIVAALGRPRPAALSWLPALGWAGLIFVLSAQPNLRFTSNDLLDFVIRKTGHMGAFGILTLLVWWALATTTPWRRPWAVALVLTGLYAASDEWHQGFTVGRHPAVLDVGIDAAGALIAVAVVLWLLGRYGRG